MSKTDVVNIPDAAVQAAIKSFESTDNNCATYQDMRKALAAALPHISAPCDAEVKKLEWTKPYERDNQQISTTVFGTYGVWDINGEGFLSKPENIGGVSVDGGIEAAKAAAQADFERRILSCVVTKPVDVAAVRRQAFEEAAKWLDDWSTKTMGQDVSPDYASSAIRALSPAEPAQGDQWRDIATAPKDGTEFIARCGADKPLFSCFWDGSAFMHYEHGEGLISYSPTEWMPLPAAPNSEE